MSKKWCLKVVVFDQFGMLGPVLYPEEAWWTTSGPVRHAVGHDVTPAAVGSGGGVPGAWWYGDTVDPWWYPVVRVRDNVLPVFTVFLAVSGIYSGFTWFSDFSAKTPIQTQGLPPFLVRKPH